MLYTTYISTYILKGLCCTARIPLSHLNYSVDARCQSVRMNTSKFLETKYVVKDVVCTAVTPPDSNSIY